MTDLTHVTEPRPLHVTERIQMTDSQMLDWLEEFVNENGAILLHDGNSNQHGHTGLGLRPGSLRRTLREAITQAAQPDPKKI